MSNKSLAVARPQLVEKLSRDARRELRTKINSVKGFTRGFVGIQLRPYQIEAADAIVNSVLARDGQSFVIIFARQSGKDELLADLILYLLARLAIVGTSIICAQPTFRPQTLISMERLQARATTRPFFADGHFHQRYGYIYGFASARVLYFSADPSAHVVGPTADRLLIVNEAQDVNKNVYDKRFAPMAAAGNATRVFSGTSWTRDTLLDREKLAALQMEKRDGIRRVFIVDAQQVAAQNEHYGAFVQNEIRKLGRDHPLVRTQYFCENIDAQSGMFTAAHRLLMQGDRPQITPQARPEQDSPLQLHSSVGEEERQSLPAPVQFLGRSSQGGSGVELPTSQQDSPPQKRSPVGNGQWGGPSTSQQDSPPQLGSSVGEESRQSLPTPVQFLGRPSQGGVGLPTSPQDSHPQLRSPVGDGQGVGQSTTATHPVWLHADRPLIDPPSPNRRSDSEGKDLGRVANGRVGLGEAHAFLLDVAGQEESSFSISEKKMELNPARDSVTLRIVSIDLSTLKTLQAPTYRVIHTIQWTGERHTTIFGQLQALGATWRPLHIVIDATGVGEGLWSMLDKAFPTKVIPVKFTQRVKSELGYGFLAIINTGRFRDCDPSQKTDREYAACESEVLIGPARTMKWGVPEGRRDEDGHLIHDDIPVTDSLTAILDQLNWSYSSPTLIVPARDPLDEMSHFRP